jgi:hypothetical protein
MCELAGAPLFTATRSAKEEAECDDRAPEAHSGADELHGVKGSDVPQTRLSEHGEAVKDAECRENKEDTQQSTAIAHGPPDKTLLRPCEQR